MPAQTRTSLPEGGAGYRNETSFGLKNDSEADSTEEAESDSFVFLKKLFLQPKRGPITVKEKRNTTGKRVLTSLPF
jgi:hypothetical protein